MPGSSFVSSCGLHLSSGEAKYGNLCRRERPDDACLPILGIGQVLRGSGHRRLGGRNCYVEVFERWRRGKRGKVARWQSLQRAFPGDDYLNYPACWGCFLNYPACWGCFVGHGAHMRTSDRACPILSQVACNTRCRANMLRPWITPSRRLSVRSSSPGQASMPVCLTSGSGWPKRATRSPRSRE
jgi:hypothetical protein